MEKLREVIISFQQDFLWLYLWWLFRLNRMDWPSYLMFLCLSCQAHKWGKLCRVKLSPLSLFMLYNFPLSCQRLNKHSRTSHSIMIVPGGNIQCPVHSIMSLWLVIPIKVMVPFPPFKKQVSLVTDSKSQQDYIVTF